MSIIERLRAPNKSTATVNAPLVALAPMAGVSDLPFRKVCEFFGADYSVTEMTSSIPRLIDTKKNQTRLHLNPDSHANVVQIIGNDADEMADAAKYYADLGADIIDINMGCPAKKVCKKAAGSALLRDIPLVTEILEKVVAASPVPVTLKTRLGWSKEEITIHEVAHIAEDVGIQLLTIHGRTRACRFLGQAQFAEITKVKATSNLPIIANGDIDSPERAQQVLQQTGCDGIMLGRASVGQPWLFRQIQQTLGGLSENKLKSTSLDSANLCRIILYHIEETHRLYGENGARNARKHIQQYLKATGRPRHLFAQLQSIEDNQTQRDKLQELLYAYEA